MTTARKERRRRVKWNARRKAMRWLCGMPETRWDERVAWAEVNCWRCRGYGGYRVTRADWTGSAGDEWDECEECYVGDVRFWSQDQREIQRLGVAEEPTEDEKS